MIDFNLLEQKVLENIKNINLDEEVLKYSFENNILEYYHKNNYCKNMTSYVNLYKPKKILELGTSTGISAVCLAYFSDKVDTFDICDEFFNKNVLLNKKINFNKIINPDNILEICYGDYDLIFVDIDHSGKYEKMIHEKIKKEYKGIVFYDDVQLTTIEVNGIKFSGKLEINDDISSFRKTFQGCNVSTMIEFWNSILENKKTLDWNSCGFGIVEYE